MDPRDFLTLAGRLAADDGAAARRSALSRAYYAVYNVAWTALLDLGFRLGRGHEAHQTVQQYLVRSNVTPVIHVGAVLRRMLDARVRADYWMRDPYPEQERFVTLWLNRAAEMIRDLDATMADPPTRERMTRALRAWEQRT